MKSQSRSNPIPLILLSILYVSLIGCEAENIDDPASPDTNQLPEILYLITSTDTPHHGQRIRIAVSAHDRDYDSLSYVWDISAGQIVENGVGGTTIYWLMPLEGTTVTVTVHVQDGVGETTRSMTMQLNESVTWTRVFPSAGTNEARSVVQKAGGNFYVLSNAGLLPERFALRKLDAVGEGNWNLTTGVEEYGDVSQVVSLGPSDFYVVGNSYDSECDGQFYLAYVTQGRNIATVWARSWGDESFEVGHRIATRDDGIVYVLGYKRYTDSDYYSPVVTAYDHHGFQQWFTSHFTSVTQHQNLDGGIVALPDGGCLVGYSSGSNGRVFFATVDGDGNVLTLLRDNRNINGIRIINVMESYGVYYAIGFDNANYGPTLHIYGLVNGESFDFILSSALDEGITIRNAAVTNDQCFILAGDRLVGTDKSSLDAILMKVSMDGVILWQQTFGGDKDDSFNDVIQAGDGGLVAVGQTESGEAEDADVWVVKTNPFGEIIN